MCIAKNYRENGDNSGKRNVYPFILRPNKAARNCKERDLTKDERRALY